MVQAAAASQLRSPIQGKQVSASRSSMWPVVVLGILTAVFAWIWYRGSGEAREAETPVQTQVTAENEQETEESELRAPGPGKYEPHPNEQEVPCLVKKLENLQVVQSEKEQQLKLHSTELPDVDHPHSGLEAQSNAVPSTIPLNVQAEQIPAVLTKGELQGDVQECNDVPKEDPLPGSIKEPPAHLQRQDELQAGIQDHPADIPNKKEPQVDLQENLTDIPKKGQLQDKILEHPIDALKTEVINAGLQEHPTDVPEAKIQEHLTDVPETEVAQADILGHLTHVSNKDEQTNLLEYQENVLRKEDGLLEQHLQGLVQTNAEETYKAFLDKTDVLYSHEVDVHPSDTPEVSKLLINGDEVHASLRKEVQLGEEQYPQDDLLKEMVQSNTAVMCCKQPVEESRAPNLLVDPCDASKSEQENGQDKEFLNPVFDSPDDVYANGEVNGTKEVAENATGRSLANTFLKEKVLTTLEAEKTSNQDSTTNTSSDGNTVVDQSMTLESLKKCDVKRMIKCSVADKLSTRLQDNAQVFASSISKSTREALPDVLELGSGPETSSVIIFNLLSNQEKEMTSLSNTDTDGKISFGSSSETNIYDVDDQKPRKVATIQPMPQNVNFAFNVHYITHSDSQIIAVTGDHEKLGKWEAYVPLTSESGGFWSHSIPLPADTTLAWKFVLVENGKIKRWEECNNRFLKTAHDDIEVQLFWGYP